MAGRNFYEPKFAVSSSPKIEKLRIRKFHVHSRIRSQNVETSDSRVLKLKFQRKSSTLVQFSSRTGQNDKLFI